MESMLDKEQLKKVLAQLKKAVKKARQDGKKVFNVVFSLSQGTTSIDLRFKIRSLVLGTGWLRDSHHREYFKLLG